MEPVIYFAAIILCSLVLIVCFYFIMRRSFGTQSELKAGLRPKVDVQDIYKLNQLRDMDIKNLEVQITTLIDELKLTSEHILQKITDKEEAVNLLIKEADWKIKDLNNALNNRQQELTPNLRKNVFNTKFSRVFKLYDQGLSIDAIAKEMKMAKGKVELIFNLKNKL
ncbi:MAG: hypothetical protein DRP78_03830 [Candidatus Omnitrophota bacterium]|nr:MAG: hypothetical protein DRP78_03830 [Candidatus Omnitrophota bacterium]